MSSRDPQPRRGLLFVLSSPSGAGKTSLSKRLVRENPRLGLSVSATTRGARPAEENGREYWFTTPAEFQASVAAGGFLEWAEVHEHLYGSPRAPIMERLGAGLDVLFDIDWQGARAIYAAAPWDTVRVFILPPSMRALSSRLHARAQDAEDVIARRLGRARGEITHWNEYDYVVVNDDIETAYAEILTIYRAESLKRSRNLWIEPMVASLLAES